MRINWEKILIFAVLCVGIRFSSHRTETIGWPDVFMWMLGGAALWLFVDLVMRAASTLGSK